MGNATFFLSSLTTKYYEVENVSSRANIGIMTHLRNFTALMEK